MVIMLWGAAEAKYSLIVSKQAYRFPQSGDESSPFDLSGFKIDNVGRGVVG
jgi:hypothetical protein